MATKKKAAAKKAPVKKPPAKKATITQPPIKKQTPAKPKAEAPAAEQPDQPVAMSKPEWDKKVSDIRKTFPNLTENDFHRYDGETDDSALRRAAERAGVTLEELLA